MHTEVKSILEYCEFEGVACFRVEWSDKSVSWETLDNLNCREIICAFFKDAIQIIKDNEKAKEEVEKKKNEEMLLVKMLEINTQTLARTSKMQKTVFDQLTNNDTRYGNTLMGLKRVLPVTQQNAFTSSRCPQDTSPSAQNLQKTGYTQPKPAQRITVPHEERKAVPLSVQRIPTEFQYQETRVKATKIAECKHNIITLKFPGVPSSTYIFFYKKDLQPLVLGVSDVLFIKLTALKPYLAAKYLSQERDFRILPCVDTDENSESPLETDIRAKKLAVLCNTKEGFWIIIPKATLGNFFNMEIKSKVVIFYIGYSDYLKRIFFAKDVIQPETAWLQDSFKFGVGMLIDKVCTNFHLSAFKKVFLIGDRSSSLFYYIRLGLERIAKEVSKLLDADTVLIQDTYLCHIHLISGFYDALRNSTRFFIVKADGLEEILPRGGMITFSNEFVKDAEPLEIANFLKKLERRPNWELKVTNSAYEIIKTRINIGIVSSEYVNSIKAIYKAFKEAICESCDDKLRDYLEMAHFRTHRHFIEIVNSKMSQVLITLDEAGKIMNTC